MVVSLAAKAPLDLNELAYPRLVLPKLDGIRAIKRNGSLYTRNDKLVRNRYIQDWARRHVLEGLDGELVLADWTRPYREVISAVSSADGEPNFCFAVFDIWSASMEFTAYRERLEFVRGYCDRSAELGIPHIRAVDAVEITRADRLASMIDDYVKAGFEGAISRDPNGRYLRKRCTTKSGLVIKHKPFADEEAVVLGIVEEIESSDLAFGAGKSRVGALDCRFVVDGTEFQCGSGLTAEERDTFWKTPSLILGKTITVKHWPSPQGRVRGEKPRFPVFKGVRNDL